MSGPAEFRRPTPGLSLIWCLLVMFISPALGTSSNLRRCPNFPKVNTVIWETNRSVTFKNGAPTSSNVTDLSINGTDKLIVCSRGPLGPPHECHRLRDCFNKLSKAFYCCRGPCHNICIHYTKLRVRPNQPRKDQEEPKRKETKEKTSDENQTSEPSEDKKHAVGKNMTAPSEALKLNDKEAESEPSADKKYPVWKNTTEHVGNGTEEVNGESAQLSGKK